LFLQMFWMVQNILWEIMSYHYLKNINIITTDADTMMCCLFSSLAHQLHE